MDSTDQHELDKLYEALALVATPAPCRDPLQYYNNKLYSDWWWMRRSYKTIYKDDIAYKNADGKLHRIYGPAYIGVTRKFEEWYKDGELHRIGGPAVIQKSGCFWLQEGKLHRLDGPAVDRQANPKEYWIGGQKLSPKEYKKEIDRRKRKGLIK